MQVAAGLKAGGELGDQRRLDQAAFVVLGLVPGVRKKDVRAVQAGQWQHVVNDFDRVMLQDADVGKRLLGDALEQRAHPGGVHFTTQKIILRP